MKVFGELDEIPSTIPEACEYYLEHLNLFTFAIDVTSKGGRQPLIENWKVGSCWPTIDELISSARLGGGIAIRLPPGLLVVDLDVSKIKVPEDPGYLQGHHELVDLMVSSGAPVETLETLTVHSPSGGSHLYYISPEMAWTGSKTVSPAIDTRTGPSGIALVPPSYGKGYKGNYSIDPNFDYARMMPSFITKKYLQKLAKVNNFIPDMSLMENLVNLSEKTSSFGERILNFYCARILQAPPGCRNEFIYNSTMNVYRYVASGQISQGDAEHKLYQASVTRSEESQKGSDIERTIQSGRENGLTKPAGESLDRWNEKQMRIAYNSDLTDT